MDDSHDEHEHVELDTEEVEEIINWCIAAGGLVVLMHNSPNHDTPEEGETRLKGFLQAIQMMHDSIPDVLEGIVNEIASETLDEAIRDEEEVEAFIQEIEEYESGQQD